jgi:hypothetical protein
VRTVIDSDSALGARSIDALLELYVSWREECHVVRQAYQWWVDSARERRDLAYAGYLAALEREEHAARVYAQQIEHVTRIYT